ncbi:SDR family oxidoreductase [Mycobacterium sp. C31M]
MVPVADSKVALVTGGGSGIGRATALAFARHGAKVVIANRGEDAGQETVQLIDAAGGEAVFIKTDVTRWADVDALVKETVATYGRLDWAVNSAGVGGQQGVPIAEASEQLWDQAIALNLKGVWLCMKAEVIEMLKRGGGAIVNISSGGGLIGVPGGAGYCASKHGVNGLTKSVALEYAQHGIRVNAVCAGGVLTPMMAQHSDETVNALAAVHPIGRLAQPEEIGDVAVWLCSDAASFATGSTVTVDGGWTIQ